MKFMNHSHTYFNSDEMDLTPEFPPLLIHRVPHRVNYWKPPTFRMLFISVTMFLLTFLTTTAIGAVYMAEFYELTWFNNTKGMLDIVESFLTHPDRFFIGLPYSLALLLILFSHEMGHYIACWYYGVDATPPVFIPAPTIIGTFGAVIRIKSPIPHRKALFDIGYAGPVAGFIMTLPFLIWGVAHSKVVPPSALSETTLFFGDPPLMKFMIALFFPSTSSDMIYIHPIAFSAWFGLLATCLNLFPIGQLDGGHMAYAILGKKARYVGMTVWGGLVLLTLHNNVWFLWTLLTLIFRFRHPPTLYDAEPIDRKRIFWGITGIIMFLLSLTFDPIYIK